MTCFHIHIFLSKYTEILWQANFTHEWNERSELIVTKELSYIWTFTIWVRLWFWNPVVSIWHLARKAFTCDEAVWLLLSSLLGISFGRYFLFEWITLLGCSHFFVYLHFWLWISNTCEKNCCDVTGNNNRKKMFLFSFVSTWNFDFYLLFDLVLSVTSTDLFVVNIREPPKCQKRNWNFFILWAFLSQSISLWDMKINRFLWRWRIKGYLTITFFRIVKARMEYK